MPDCPIDGCEVELAPGMLMCFAHWQKVPSIMATAIRAVTRAWTRGDVELSSVEDVQNNAIAYVNREQARAAAPPKRRRKRAAAPVGGRIPW